MHPSTQIIEEPNSKLAQNSYGQAKAGQRRCDHFNKPSTLICWAERDKVSCGVFFTGTVRGTPYTLTLPDVLSLLF